MLASTNWSSNFSTLNVGVPVHPEKSLESVVKSNDPTWPHPPTPSLAETNPSHKNKHPPDLVHSGVVAAPVLHLHVDMQLHGFNGVQLF